MIYLLISILACSYLILSFKVFERLKINIPQVIVFNYLTCALTGCFVNHSFPQFNTIYHYPWFPWAVILGVTFVTIFNLMGIVTVRMGASVTGVANKLSMIIPVAFSFYQYHDPVTFLIIAGIVLSLAAVVLTSLKEDKNHKLHFNALLLPLIVFIGSGFNDSVVKFSQVYYIKLPAEVNLFNIVLFFVAFMAGGIAMLYNIFTGKVKFQWKAIIAGIILGVPNYFSLYSLIKLLQQPGWNSSVIFPINNICIVGLTALLAFLLFKEHLSRKNLLGLGLAMLSIYLILISR